jgi:hypothetical protein
LLTALAPEPQPRLELDPSALSGNDCLAPAYESDGCLRESLGAPNDSRLSASAALLAPDLPQSPPSLRIDMAVLRPGAELTYSCSPAECDPQRRIFPAGGLD